jgi:hypothetical protein
MPQETPGLPSHDEYNPDKFLQTLPPVLDNEKILRRIVEVKDTEENKISEERRTAVLAELEGQLLDEQEAKRLDSEVLKQLHEDIVTLHSKNPNTFGALLNADDAGLLIYLWGESGAYNGGMSLQIGRDDPEAQKMAQQVSQKLRELLQEVAEKNGWKIEFTQGLTWRAEQFISVSDGERVVSLEPTFFQFDDGSAIDPEGSLVEKIGMSHLRKYVTLQVENEPERVLYLERGILSFSRLLTREEAEFLEKVVAAYY